MEYHWWVGVPGKETALSSAPCPAGTVLVGGGATTIGSAAISDSRAVGGTWVAAAIRVTGNAIISVTAVALCAS